jgi:hypothetical protein
VLLQPETPFTDWLLQQAATDFGDWGVLLRSDRPFLGMRSHCRSLCKARLPSGEEIALDWMDPPVLRALLPLANIDQIAQLLAPLASLVMVSPAAWTVCTQQFGRLSLRTQPVLEVA